MSVESVLQTHSSPSEPSSTAILTFLTRSVGPVAVDPRFMASRRAREGKTRNSD